MVYLKYILFKFLKMSYNNKCIVYSDFLQKLLINAFQFNMHASVDDSIL